MSIGERLDKTLTDFEAKTEGILGSCVIYTSDALMMAEASHRFDRNIIQGLSAKLITLGKETLSVLFDSFTLKSVTLEEENHFIYVRPVSQNYHVVVITDKSETPGLREMNIKELIKRLDGILTS